MKNISNKLCGIIIITIITFVLTDVLFSASNKRKNFSSRFSSRSVKNDNNDGIIETLLKLYQKDKKNYYVNTRLGWLYYMQQKYSNVKHHYKNAIRSKSSAIEPKLGMYLVYTAQRNYYGAQKYCKFVVKLDEYNYYGNLYLMYSYTNNTNYKNAAEVAKKMLRKYPSDLTFLRQLKFLYGKMNKKKELINIQAKIDLLSISPKLKNL